MKIIAYTALHYGKEYLAWAMRSVLPVVDEWHILYSSQGSHGTRTSVPCPETRDELYTLSTETARDKLHWHDGDWTYEGQQRDTIFEVAPDADVILNVDYDEIWNNPLAVLHEALGGDKREYRVSMVHFWRSFRCAVVDDPAYPVRVILPKRKEGIGDITVSPIAHMGYAISSELVLYKSKIHGHRAEWRTDVNWFSDVWMKNRCEDCHPTNLQYWYPVAVEPDDYLPAFMRYHPYYTKALID